MKNNFTLTILAILVILTGNAATIYVNSATGNDANTGSLASPYKTFHKAYTMAAASGDVINLTGTFDWTASDEVGDVIYSGYELNKSLTIQGQGRDFTFVQAASTYNTADRCVFFVGANKTVVFNDITIRFGKSTTDRMGGGLTLEGAYCANYPCATITGTAVLNRVNVVNNNAQTSLNVMYQAGGIYLREASTITLNEVNVNSNNCSCSSYSAGAIAGGEQSQSLTMKNSTISSNTATSTLGNAWPYDYVSVSGGIALQRFGAFTMTNSTVSYNSTDNYGGAIVINSNYYPTITYSTIVNNSATLGASGILFNTTNGDQIYIKNTIIADNTNGSSDNDFYSYDTGSGNAVVASYCIIENQTNTTLTGTGMLTGNQVSLGLSSTADINGSMNGTKTFALAANSVAINAGNSSVHGSPYNFVFPPSTDQRGRQRIGTPDIGSYERVATREWIGSNSSAANVSSNWTNSTIPTTGENVSISPSAVNDLVLTNNLSIGDLTFNGGGKKVDLGNYDLTVISISGANATNFIKTSGTGKLKQTRANNISAVYPIGNSSYNPITITNKSGASDVFSARVVDGAFLEGLTGAAINSTVLNRTWDIYKTNANAGFGVDFVFNWNAGEVVNGIFTSPKMNHYSSVTSNWEVPTVTSTTFGANMLTVVGYTGTFSPFTVAEGTSALPVELTTFNAICSEIGTSINWQTASEHNSASFDVEKSRDGNNWSLLESIQAAGNSTTLVDYSVVDSEKVTDVMYYRLNQIDLNGEHKIYGPVSANCNATSEFSALVFPNPASGNVTIELNSYLPQAIDFTIIAIDGKSVYNSKRSVEVGMTQIPLSVELLNSGVYTIQLKSDNSLKTIKFFIK